MSGNWPTVLGMSDWTVTAAEHKLPGNKRSMQKKTNNEQTKQGKCKPDNSIKKVCLITEDN